MLQARGSLAVSPLPRLPRPARTGASAAGGGAEPRDRAGNGASGAAGKGLGGVWVWTDGQLEKVRAEAGPRAGVGGAAASRPFVLQLCEQVGPGPTLGFADRSDPVSRPERVEQPRAWDPGWSESEEKGGRSAARLVLRGSSSYLVAFLTKSMNNLLEENNLQLFILI
ncbi:uncharacterized protein LOC132533934 isoform X2 [Erinaceus europaeus]|uniref:Uncharacterized protein LOC132533934 isoform X2 n=1 Tax=Erinaceus europaeus TaxID=9365 RepID=A0ABM3W9H3_ERIEU|nr:uncharacterized protein LOC132533934 isoform X2 [Erinaceus europaeus]